MTNRLAVIVAASTNDAIGKDGDMPWHLSEDLKRFKRLTMGHHIIMGRKTYDSIGRLLPGRTTVIVTRQTDFVVPGATVVNSLSDALKVAANDDCPFITGGAQIYELALPMVTEIFLTRIHATIEGDTYFPRVDWGDWQLVEETHGETDSDPPLKYSFQDYSRRAK